MNERSRQLQIAQDALTRLYQGKDIASIEDEPLEALSWWLEFELQDRRYRMEKVARDLLGDESPF